MLAACAGLLFGQPAVAASSVGAGPRSAAQLDPSVRVPICQLIETLQVEFAGFPAAAGMLAALLQSLGCSDAPTPGTTTSIVVTTTTTAAPATTTTTGGTGTTAPTTLPPCMPTTTAPNGGPPTTVPCLPAT